MSCQLTSQIPLLDRTGLVALEWLTEVQSHITRSSDECIFRTLSSPRSHLTMTALTRTTNLSAFTFPPPEVGRISFNEPSKIGLSVPIGSAWTSGRHWHDYHVEHYKVLSGAMLITMNNNSYVITEDSPILSIPRKVRHELMRWDCPGRTNHQKAAQEAFRKDMIAKGRFKELEELGAQEVQAEESTTPEDGEKDIFFRNFLSAMSEPRTSMLGEVLRYIQIVIIYQGLDARMVVVDMQPESENGWRAMIEETIWWLIVSMANLVGVLFGLESVNKAYTPDPLFSQWEERKPQESG